jgi:hypothetical protein
MDDGKIIVSNERLKRLDDLAQSALTRRRFDVAEELFAERLSMLSQYHYVDDLSLALTLNNLAFTQECQSKLEQAEAHRKQAREICTQKLEIKPVVHDALPPRVQHVKPSHLQQIRVMRSA